MSDSKGGENNARNRDCKKNLQIIYGGIRATVTRGSSFSPGNADKQEVVDRHEISAAASQTRIWAWGCALVVIVIAVYLPAFRMGFIWDDDDYVTNNPCLRDAAGLGRIWLQPGATPQYYPLTHTSFWLEYQAWGLEPAGYHATNVLLHAAAAILLWRLLVLLEMPGAWLAACAFAIHPINVETVAWVTERKNVLSLLFSLASILAYWKSGTTRRGYAIAIVSFIAAMLSKTVACSVPAVIVVLLWWKHGRVKREDVWRLIPMFAIGLLLAGATVYLERFNVGARGKDWALSPAERVIIAGRAIWFYISKLILPTRLTFIYPRWEIDARAILPWIFPLTIAGAMGVLWWKRDRIGRGPIAAMVLFCGVMLPALGLVDVYPMRYAFVADHFQYAGGIVLIATVAAIAVREMKLREWTDRQRSIAGAVVVVLLGALTLWQQRAYRDLPTLWRDTIAQNPGCWMAETNLAVCHLRANELVDAEFHVRRALAIKPDLPEGHNTLGAVLARAGYAEPAAAEFAEALRLRPDYPAVHVNWGALLARSRNLDAAIEHFHAALRIQPGNRDALHNLQMVGAADVSDVSQ